MFGIHTLHFGRTLILNHEQFGSVVLGLTKLLQTDRFKFQNVCCCVRFREFCNNFVILSTFGLIYTYDTYICVRF